MQQEHAAYPKWKYSPNSQSQVVYNPKEEGELEGEWFESPAQFGVETCPGKRPDPIIAERKKACERPQSEAKADLQAIAERKKAQLGAK